jgi:hypothetical protein
MSVATVERTERGVTAKLVAPAPEAEPQPTPAWAQGRELAYPGDAWLEAPELYYNPDELNGRFRAFVPQAGPGEYYQHMRFQAGRFLALTEVERGSVRRKLGRLADRYRGDDMSHEWVCPNQACRFATRNQAAWQDHNSTTEHDRPWQPQPF